MKRRLLTIALVLALCLSLAATAFAWDYAGDPHQWESIVLETGATEVRASNGFVYRFSNPIIGEISNFTEYEEGNPFVVEGTCYKVPIGTVVTVEKPDGTPGTIFQIEYGSGATDYDSDTYTVQWPGMCLLSVEGASTRLDLYGVAPKFTDVQDTDWFAKPVAWAVEQNITTGTTATTFSPYQDCSIAQILTFLWRAAGSPEAKAIEGMDQSLYYAGAVAWAVEKGMISAEDFTATAPCTRSMAVQFIWQAAGSPEAEAASFEDVPADAAYADAVAWAVKAGVTTGTSDTTFAPDTVCNRGHIVTFLFRAFAEA